VGRDLSRCNHFEGFMSCFLILFLSGNCLVTILEFSEHKGAGTSDDKVLKSVLGGFLKSSVLEVQYMRISFFLLLLDLFYSITAQSLVISSCTKNVSVQEEYSSSA